MLPYFDALFGKLQEKDTTTVQAFGEHVHWGYWDTPPTGTITPSDFHHAEELMLRHVVEKASILDGDSVLDVGCGLGGTIKFLNETFCDCALTGVNIDERQIALARQTIQARQGNAIEFILADACALPFSKPTFDVVLCVESIFHFSDREIFFKECQRVLKPGGRLIISDFVPVQAASSLFNFLEHTFDLVSPVYGEIRLDISVPKYKKIAQHTGFSLEEVHDITAHTLPTYGFLNNVARLHPAGQAKKMLRSNFLTEYASKSGTLQYLILSFGKKK